MKIPNPFARFVQSRPAIPATLRGRQLGLASLALAVVLFYLAVRGLDWAAFLAILRNGNYAWLPLLFVWNSLAYLAHGARWWVLVQGEKKVSLADAFYANMVGFLGNLVLPARAGSLVRAGYLAQLTGASATYNIATQVVQRVVDSAVLILIGSLALAASGVTSPLLQDALRASSSTAAVSLVVMFLLPRFGGPVERFLNWLPLPGETLKPRVVGIAHKFLLGLDSLRDVRRAGAFAGLTAAIWLLDGPGMLFSALLLNIPVSLVHMYVLLAAWGLATVIPLTPDGLGVVQFVAVTVLAIFDVSRESALALTLFGQIFRLVIVGFWSVLGLLRVR